MARQERTSRAAHHALRLVMLSAILTTAGSLVQAQGLARPAYFQDYGSVELRGLRPSPIHADEDYFSVSREFGRETQRDFPISLCQGTEEGGGSSEDPSTQTFGEEPPRRTQNTLQFLRSNSVLLRPGQWQMDVGLAYLIAEDDPPLGAVDGNGNLVGVIDGGLKRRLLYVPLQVRYGLTERIQLSAFLPVGWSNGEFAFAGFDDFNNKVGIGDLNAGASILMRKGCGCRPDVIANVGFTAPTGDAQFPRAVTIPGSSLGEGFWALNAGLLFIQRYDPIILYYGFGYRHLFETTFDGIGIQPGEQAYYNFGVGFAVNECVTLSTGFLGYYLGDRRENDLRVPGTTREPMRLRFAVTVAQRSRICEPFAEIGMTDAAPAARIGIVWTF